MIACSMLALISNEQHLTIFIFNSACIYPLAQYFELLFEILRLCFMLFFNLTADILSTTVREL